MVPITSIVASTPSRSNSANETTPANRNVDTACQTPSSSTTPVNYRLLYRGALSLPDSYLLLDGLTFIARLHSPTKHQLLENPLALALESMRGRQSLRFLGTVELKDVWLDESGNVEMNIHPRAALSKIYFENIFCLLPYPPASTSQQAENLTSGTSSELGVRIALGDTDGPETTHIVVFGYANGPDARSVKLKVARITPHPPSRRVPGRVPRPDDPTPRRPPKAFTRTNSLGGGILKRSASSSSSALALRLGVGEGGTAVKKQKLTASSDKDRPKELVSDEVFKVPSLPAKSKGKGKDKEDVFGSGSVSRKVPRGDVVPHDAHETETERANKNFIKKVTLEHLCKTKDPTLQRTVDRSHPEFKDIWAAIYRGVGFALRAHIKITPLDLHDILPLIENHSHMYIGEPRDIITPHTSS